MQTSPIMNPANLVQNLTANARPSDNAAPDASFNQVFSRELADRHSQREAEKSAPSQNASPAPQQPAPAAANKAPDAGSAGETQEQAQDETTVAPDAASVEMLALVQANAVPLDPRTLAALTPDSGLVRDAIRAIAPAAVEVEIDIAATDVAVKTDAEDFAAIALQQKSLAASLAEPANGQAKPAPVTTDLSAQLAANLQKLQPAAPASAGQPPIEANAGLGKELTALAATATAARPETSNTKETPIKPADPATALNVGADVKPTVEAGAAAKSAALASLAAASEQATPEPIIAKATEAPTVAMLSALQQAAPAHAQALGGPASDRLAPKVGTPGWDNALGQKLSWMVSGGVQSATLNLNPPDLGPMQVVLNISNTQATASFTAAQPEVRQALENAMPRLREMMAETGIQLGQTSVGTGMPNQNQNQYGAAGDQAHPASRHFAQAAALAEKAPVIVRPLASGSGQGMIDTFA